MNSFRDIEVAGGVGAEFQAVEGLAEIPGFSKVCLNDCSDSVFKVEASSERKR